MLQEEEDSEPSASFSWAPAGPPYEPVQTHSGAWRQSEEERQEEELAYAERKKLHRSTDYAQPQ